jgi:WD40 repeat protein
VATKNAVISISTPRTSSGIVWSPDGGSILFRYPDSQLSVWDVNPQSGTVGTEQLRLRPGFNVTGLVWNEAGTHLLTWADDGTIQVWFSDIDDYLALGQASKVREFDNQDRERFFLPTETPEMERSS